jgi:antitoxin MazE
MDAAKFRVGQSVDIREELDRIVIEPLRMPAFDLDELIAAITAENRHAEIDFGDAIGNEHSSRRR